MRAAQSDEVRGRAKEEAVADYRLSVNIISRGQGQSVVACAAYRAGADFFFNV